MKKSILLLFVFIFLLAACNPQPAATPTAAALPTETPVPPTPTPVPVVLNVCLGTEPESLFIYNGLYSQSMLSVLEAIYDGPVDTINDAYQPVILEKVPSLADGDALLTPVTLTEGMDLVDADGNLVTLHAGVRYFPSGCTSAECVVAWDGKAAVSVDQLSATFKIKPGVTWSDGTPLTADDSVFSYQLAASPAIPAGKAIIAKTAAYTAIDPQTVEWKAVPGFIDQQYGTRFWLPLPAHQLEGRDPAALLTDPLAIETPAAWGAFMIREWVRGDHITLTRNPHYFRAAEGKPAVDILNFVFTGSDPATATEMLLSGKCDVVDTSAGLDGSLEAIKQLADDGKISLIAGPSSNVEMLNLNIKPASYDDGYYMSRGDRADFFGDVNVRKAVAQCINRDAINRQLLQGFSVLPGTYQPVANAADGSGTGLPAYDPAAGAALLEAAGWRDQDNDPSTPRMAFSVASVIPGTLFEISLATTPSGLRMAVAERVAADLQQCGIKVNVSYQPAEQLFAAGPEGVVFGRQFDLSTFYWGAVSSRCQIYEGAQVPSAKNGWIGANITGSQSAAFDQACLTSRAVLPGQAGYESAMAAPQEVFAAELPAIPLYQVLRVAAARPDLCGLEIDGTSRSLLWNIENIAYGELCP